jgi:hypothetical protein
MNSPAPPAKAGWFCPNAAGRLGSSRGLSDLPSKTTRIPPRKIALRYKPAVNSRRPEDCEVDAVMKIHPLLETPDRPHALRQADRGEPKAPGGARAIFSAWELYAFIRGA